jgi:hypothetical protein
MKKIIFFICILFASKAFAQTTYYWIGGAGPTSYTANNNWNTALNGSGSSRSVAGAQVTDILIFDGSNIGGNTPTTGLVTATATGQTCRQLIFQNGATVWLNRIATGSASIVINGDGTATDDLVIDGTSTVTLGGPLGSYDVNFTLGANATGLVSGTAYLSPLSTSVHTRSYISAPTAGSLVFATGASCYITDSTATSGFNGAVNGSVIFKTGSSLYYYSGRSPIGSNSTTQFANFEPGSNCYFRGSSVSYLDNVTLYTSSNWAAQKTFGNVFVQNGATIAAEGPLYKIENLSIDNGCTYTLHSSGNTPVLGNLTVNGTLNAAAGTNVLVMGGNTSQTISGAGSINVPGITIANYSDVTLSKNITVSNACIVVGKINFGATNQVSGTGTFTSRVTSSAASVTGNTLAGSYLVTGITGTLSGNAGLYITGSGIDVNTNVVGFSTSNATISLSKPATSTVIGASFTFASDTAMLTTANTNGMDTLTGSVILTGSKSFQSGTNYEINAPTTAPLGISSGTPLTMTAGRITLNAAVTSNYNTKISDKIILNSGKFAIRPTDTVRITSGNDIVGAPFNVSKYIVSNLSGNNAGVLRIDNFSSSKLFPVGSTTNYLPATLTPSSAMDYAVSVFEGVTEDGTPTGTAFTTLKKKSIVDAVWTVNRINGTGDCVLETAWPSSLEGTDFSAYSNSQIGIGRYSAGSWGIVTGAGDNTANTAAATFSSFSPFAVGRINYILPIQFKNITATLQSTGVLINWSVANESSGYTYTVEKSSNGADYISLTTIIANNKANYSFVDRGLLSSKNFYRIKMINADGKITYSDIALVRKDLIAIDIYPNPVTNTMHITNLATSGILKISNFNGQVILQKNMNEGSQTVNVNTLAPGIYTLEIFTNAGRITKKTFIKE